MRTSGYFPKLNIGSTFSDIDCPIAAIEFKDIVPDKNIDVINSIDSIYDIYKNYYIPTKLQNISGLYTYHPYFINTNSPIIITDMVSDNGLPLFYQYELLYNCYGNINDGNIVTIYKNNNELVDPSTYKLQFSYDLLDSNLRYSNTIWDKQGNTSTYTHRIRILFSNTIQSNDFYVIKYKKIYNNIINYTEELLSYKILYSDSYYTITSSGIQTGSDINNEYIYYMYDPKSQINISSVQTFCSGNLWKLCINSGIIYDDNNLYNISNLYNSNYTLSGIIPEYIYSNIIKVNPSYINIPSGYIYPNYDSNIKVRVNNTDMNIKSVDYNNGYIYLDNTCNNIDNITVDFDIDTNKVLILDKVELNPYISGSVFNISSYNNGIGISALKVNSNEISKLFIYDIDSNISTRECYEISPSGSYETLPWDNMITISEIYKKNISKDNINIYDARRIGGGYKDNIIHDNLKNTENSIEYNWYSDIGFYDGEPFANNGLIIINIPEYKLNNLKQKWIDEYITYSEDPIKAYNDAIREYNYYLDFTIRKYISAGSSYVLVPVTSSGTFGDIVDLQNY